MSHRQLVVFFFFFFFFWVVLEFELRVLCQAGALPFEPCPQSFLLWLFWKWNLT
jgi:hypothetical protein